MKNQNKTTKKNLNALLWVFLFFFQPSLFLYSQNYDDAVSLTLGATQDGFAVLPSYNLKTKRNSFIQIGAFASFSNANFEQNKIPYQIFTAQFGYYKRVISSRFDKFILSGGIGGVLGYEVVNNGSDTLDTGALITTESGFIYGPYIGVDIDYYVSEKISFILKANQYYHITSDLGEFIPYLGVGGRYIIF